MASLQCLYTCRPRNKENMLDILSEMSDISDRRCLIVSDLNHAQKSVIMLQTKDSVFLNRSAEPPPTPADVYDTSGGIWSFSGDWEPLCVPKGRFYFVVMF